MPLGFGWPGAPARYASAVLATPGLRHYWRFDEGVDPYTSTSYTVWTALTSFVDEVAGANGVAVAATVLGSAGPGWYGQGAGGICCNVSQDAAINVQGTAATDHNEYLTLPAAPMWTQGTVEAWVGASEAFAPPPDSPRWHLAATNGTSLRSHGITRQVVGPFTGHTYTARLVLADFSVVTITAVENFPPGLGEYATEGSGFNHCVLTWRDGVTCSFWMNGHLVNTVALGTTWKGADRFFVGDPVTMPRGYVDELALYDQELDEATIKAHLALGRNCQESPIGRVRAWQID